MDPLEFCQLAKVHRTFADALPGISLIAESTGDFAIGECPIGESLIRKIPISRRRVAGSSPIYPPGLSPIIGESHIGRGVHSGGVWGVTPPQLLEFSYTTPPQLLEFSYETLYLVSNFIKAIFF
jgi:hypothetical protein